MADINIGKFINNLDKEDLSSEDLQGVVNNVYAKAISDHKKRQKTTEDNTKEQDKETATFIKANHDRLKAHKKPIEKDIDKDDATAKDKVAKEINESFANLSNKEKIDYVIDNYKKITGRNISGVYAKGMGEDENAPVFNQDHIDATADRIEKFLKKNGMSSKEIDDFYYDLDAELASRYNELSVRKPKEKVNEAVAEYVDTDRETGATIYKNADTGRFSANYLTRTVSGSTVDEVKDKLSKLQSDHINHFRNLPESKKINEETILPGNIYDVLVKKIPAKDIDHYNSDLYVRKTPQSTEIINKLSTKSLLSTFKDNIDGDIWYELPFCYTPHLEKKESKKVNEELSDEEIFDILGIEQENRTNSKHLLSQFRRLQKKYGTDSIWLKGDVGSAVKGKVIGRSNDLAVVESTYHKSDIKESKSSKKLIYTIGDRFVAHQLDGITSPFVREFDASKKYRDISNDPNFKHGSIGCKGKSYKTGVNQWVKDVEPSEFMVWTKKENPSWKDDVLDVYYRKDVVNETLDDPNKTEFQYAFQITKNIIFNVDYYTLGSNTTPYFSTSAGEFNRPKSDYKSVGQAQEYLLKGFPTAYNFYKKWDEYHLKDLTDEQYEDLLKDIENLKQKYNFVEQKQETFAGTDSGISFYQKRELSKQPLKRGAVETESKEIKEDWTVFEFTSGSNPYIAKTDKEVKRLLRKYKNKVKKINDTHYEVDDRTDNKFDLFPVKESKKLTEAEDGNMTIETSTSILDMFYPSLYQTIDDYYIPEGEWDRVDDILARTSMDFAEDAIKEVFPSATLKFKELRHPRQYNFGGENIIFDVTLPRADYERVKQEVAENPEFAQFLKKNSPRSGYIPFGAYTVDKFKTQDDMYSIGQIVKFFADNEDLQYDFDDKFREEIGSNFETYDYLWEEVMDWLKEHDQAYQDFLTHFNADENSVIDLDSIIGWISDHDTLAQDFENYFGFSINESLVENYKGADAIEPGDFHKVAIRELPAEDIDHHESDLYIRKTPKSTELIKKLTTDSLLSTFRDQIDNDIWYELPFCYNPFWQSKNNIKEGRSIPRNATKIKVGGKEFTKDGDWVDDSRVHVSPRDIKRFYGDDVEVIETDPNYKPKRTKEVKVLQGNYGYGWDDLVEYEKEDYAELRQDLKSYRENEKGASFRVVTRRVPLGESRELKESIKERYKDTRKQAAYENACDCIIYGYGKSYWNSLDLNDEEKKEVWKQAFNDIAETESLMESQSQEIEGIMKDLRDKYGDDIEDKMTEFVNLPENSKKVWKFGYEIIPDEVIEKDYNIEYYQTPEHEPMIAHKKDQNWKWARYVQNIDYNDILYTEKGWNKFKKWLDSNK